MVGQKATNSVYTTFCLLTCTAMSLSWLPSSVTVTMLQVPKLQPLFRRRLNVGSLWRTSVKSTAKLFITHGHQHIELNHACAVHHPELPANSQTPPGTTSTHPDITTEYPQIITRKYPKHLKGSQYYH